MFNCNVSSLDTVAPGTNLFLGPRDSEDARQLLRTLCTPANYAAGISVRPNTTLLYAV